MYGETEKQDCKNYNKPPIILRKVKKCHMDNFLGRQLSHRLTVHVDDYMGSRTLK